jgi:patatin-like phospholipase/acyl hydrolase
VHEAIPSTFQILSLDGGGIKGLFSAAVLAHIEDDCGVRISDHFDLITGTSTGGIIALGLGLGLSPREIVQFYCDHGPAIFRDTLRVRGLTHWVRRKFPASALLSALQTCFGDATLAKSTKRLVVPSYNLGEDDVYLFKTPHHTRLKRDFKLPMWKVAMSTSAAPTYFPSFRQVDHVRLVDGGVWANNPTMVGIVEAVSMLDVRLDAIRVLSLGTSDPVTRRPSRLDSGGLLPWAKSAVNVVMRGQSLGAHKQALHLLGKDAFGKDKVARLDPRVPDGLFKMDCLREKDLMGKAAHESRIFTPTFDEQFKPHIAPAYQPLYTS